ncbi:MAG: hypothetical protein GX260_05240 [Tissierellia bacterium]|nr:hypothetical protein [Bacillota bacterium]NLL23168.1 hypothetical protein [Tissierellia bacterium]
MKRVTEWFLILFFFLTSFVPLCGWVTGKDSPVFASQRTSRMPAVMKEGKLNTRWTLEFDDHWGQSFPYHSFLTSRYNQLIQCAFRSSANQKVIVGKNDFYFFGESVDDLLKHRTLSKNDLLRLLRVLEMQSEYVHQQGAEYLFFVAPNKATIYPEYLPFHLLPVGEKSNLDVLETLPSEVQIYSARRDLYSAKQTADVLLFHKEDSHWNSLGAYEVYKGLMKSIRKSPVIWGETVEARRDFQGDLTTMFYPDRRKEDVQWYDPSYKRQYIELRPIRSLEDMRIETRCSNAEKKIVMYRDSFANALIPFISDSFKESLFLRSDTVDLREVEAFDADYVVYEIVERNLNWILQRTPIMPAPEAVWKEGIPLISYGAEIEVKEAFGMTFVNAKWLSEADGIERVLVQMEGFVMEAFPIFQDDEIEDDFFHHGFSLYTDKKLDSLRIQFLKDGSWYELKLNN